MEDFRPKSATDWLVRQRDDFAAGRRIRVEDYLAQEPGLSSDLQLCADLVYGEYCLRCSAGETPASEEYLSRFPQLRSQLETLFQFHAAAEQSAGGPNSYDTTPYEADVDAGSVDAETAERPDCGRFQIVRPHARGGLGEVYVAQDDELHRPVALKRIQNRFIDDADSRARFVREAEITGNLEHPGIVPVYGFGADADGRPYYAMRFIQGESLRDAIERFHGATQKPAERGLELRKLLRRFLDVCNAIEYAHSRGVLHRDLKPANIMVGKYGETLVVDWGLARPIGRGEKAGLGDESTLRPTSDATPTQIGAAVGTPQYMSPEQAAGRHDELTPAADVYSLGAVLYSILTGRPPVEGRSLGEILQKVQQGAITPPAKLRPDVSPSLESICLKALALPSDARYASAKLLADDVERWLGDERVTAHRESFAERWARWARTHRTAVAAAIALTATAVVALVIGIVAVSVEQRRTEAARADEAAQRSQAVANAAEAVRQRGIAETSAQVADEQRNLALYTLDTLVFDVQEQLANRPGLSDLKRKVLDTARENLTKISAPLVARQASGGRPTTDRLAAVALSKSGDILMTLGATDEALKLYREGLRILDQPDVAAATPPAARRDRAVLYNQLAHATAQQGDLAGSRRFYEQGLAVSEKLAAEEPTNAVLQRDVSISCEKLGHLTARQGDLSAARRFCERGLAISTKLADADPTDVNIQRDLSVLYNQAGHVAAQQGDPIAARKFYEQGLAISEKLAVDRANTQALRDRSISYERLGEVTVQLGDLTAARKHYDQALTIRRRLAEDDPADAQGQRDLAVSYNQAGYLAAKQEDFAAARDYYERGLAISRRLSNADPANNQARRDLTISYERLGIVAGELRDWNSAQSFYEQSLAIREQLAAADSADAQAQRDLSIAYNKLGDAVLRSEDVAEARRLYRQGLAIAERLAADPVDAQAQRDLMISHYHLGTVSSLAEEYADAKREFESGAAILRRMIARGMNVTQSQSELAELQAEIAACEAALQGGASRKPTRAEPE